MSRTTTPTKLSPSSVQGKALTFKNGMTGNQMAAAENDPASSSPPGGGSKRLSKVNSSRSRLKSKKQKGSSPPNIFEPLVELRPASSTKATKSSYDETYKYLQEQLAKSHKKSQRLNLLRHQDSNLNPFVPTVPDPTPSQTLEAESRKNEALLEIYTDSGTFSKVVAMTVAASVLDTKMPCDVTQCALDAKKREELYRFCHDTSAILGVQDMKAVDGGDFRRLWHLYSIFTNALEQQRRRPDENIAGTTTSTSNLYNGRIGRVLPLEETVSDADLVENIKNTNPTLYTALSDPLKRFLIVYGRYIDAGHVTKSRSLRNNVLNDFIKKYRERMSLKLRPTTALQRPESPMSKIGAPQQPAQNLKILQNLRPTDSKVKKLTVAEAESPDGPSQDSIDSVDDNAKYVEDAEFGSSHLLEKLKKTNGLSAAKRKEETSWIQAYHRSEKAALWKLAQKASLQLKGQAIASPTATPDSPSGDITPEDSTEKVNNTSTQRAKFHRRRKKHQTGSTTAFKIVLKRYRRRPPVNSSPTLSSPGHASPPVIVSKLSVTGTAVKPSPIELRKKPKLAMKSKKFKKSAATKTSSSRLIQRSLQTTKRQEQPVKATSSAKDLRVVAKRSPTTLRTVSYTSKSRILHCEAIYRGIIPKPKGDVPGLCPSRCKTICLEGCRYDVVRRIALESGFKEVGEHDVWNIIWTDIPISMEKALEMRRFQNAHTIFWGTSPPVQKANHFPGMNEICRKDRLARNLNRMKKSFPDDYNFFPRTWSLPADVADLLMYSRVKKNATYICKPDSGCQGKGIFLARNLKKLNPFAKLICQVYIPKPLLIDGYKFDLRIYILVTCCDPLRVFIYNEGIARFATIKYSPPNDSNIDMIYMHLTNYSLNKFSQSYDTHGEGSKRKLSSVMNTLEAGGCDVNKLRDAIDSVIVKTMIAAQPTLRHYYRASFPKHEYGSACFEILGFDILIDQNLKPFLLEVNHSPSFNLDLPVDAEIKEALLKDTLNIVYLGTASNGKKSKAKQSVSAVATSESAARLNKALQLQFAHENAHCGNFRLIYPIDNGADYGEFFDQVSNPSMLTDPSQLTKKKVEIKIPKTKSVVY